MFLVSNHGLDQLHRAAKTQCAAVQAEIVCVHRAPLLGGVVFAVGCPALVGFLDQALGLLRRHLLALGHAGDPVLQRGTDKQAQQIGILCQGIIGAAADDNAGAFLRDVADGLENRQMHLLLQRFTGSAGKAKRVSIHGDGV